MSETALTQGAHHVGLTVPNLDDARAFFVDTLGFAQVGEKPLYPAVFVSDGSTMITLWQAADPGTAVAFDRKNVIGLHHIAFKVGDAAALDAVYGKVRDASGVAVEFAPENVGDGPNRHMMCTIPGGIRVEFFAPGS